MRSISFMLKILLAATLLCFLPAASGCKTASDSNKPPVITAIKALLGSTEQVELARDITITLKVEYTDEDYSSNGSGDIRFEPDIMWSARFDGTSTYFNDNFVDPAINSAIFTVPDTPGLLRIEVTLTDRYGEVTHGYKLIEISENTAPIIRDFTIGGTISAGLIPQVKRDEQIQVEVKYIDDDYDPESDDPDPAKKPDFLWTAEWHNTGVGLNANFFDSTTNPALFDTPDETGFIKFTVVVTDRDSEASEDSVIIEISDNEPPEITSLDIGNVVFHISLERTLKVEADDPDDSGGTLTYEWGADGGNFTTLKTLDEVKWQADAVGDFNLYVTVTDEDGGWDRADFTLKATNAAPEISGYQIEDKNPEPGAAVKITLDVTDPDSEDDNLDLVYDWSADGGGFASELVTDTGAEAEWLAPQTLDSYVISVTVYDPWGGDDTINLPPITVETGSGE
jgi:hypothetical protein